MTTNSPLIKAQISKCLTCLRQNQIETCRDIFNTLKIETKESSSLHVQHVVLNNSLVCDGIIFLKTGKNADSGNHIRDGFERLLHKTTESPLAHEEQLTLDLVVASNLIAWCISQNDVTPSSVLRCVNAWDLCLKRTNSFIQCKTKKIWRRAEAVTPEVFSYLNSFTSCILYFCMCLMVLLHCISTDYVKGKHILKSLDSLQLEELSEPQDFLYLLNVTCLVSGRSCVQLSAICKDMSTMCKAFLSFMEKDFLQAANHLRKISTVEWKVWCNYIAAFAIYEAGEDFSEVMQKLRNLLTVNDTKLDAGLKARIYNLMGCVLAKQNEPYMAVDRFEQAMSTYESILVPLYNISLQYRKLELQDAEMETLDLLCKQLKNRASVKSCSYEQRNLMLCPLLRIVDTIDDDLAYFPICLMMARRCLSLHRYDVAAEKYLLLMTAMIKSPVLVNSSFKCSLPDVKDVFHEAAFSLLKCYRYRDALDVCHQAISAHIQYTSPRRNESDIKVAYAGTSKESALPSQTVSAHWTLESTSCPPVLGKKPCSADKLGVFNVEARKRRKSDHSLEDSSGAMDSKSADPDYMSDDVLAWTIKAHAHFRLGDKEASLIAANRILTCLAGVHALITPEDKVGSEPPVKRPKRESGKLRDSDECDLKMNLVQLKAHIHNLKAVIQSQNNCLDDAWHNLRLALQLMTDDTSVQYNYTLLMVKMHRKEEGLRNWLQFRQKSHSLGSSCFDSDNLFSTGAAEDDFLKLDSLAKQHTKS